LAVTGAPSFANAKAGWFFSGYLFPEVFVSRGISGVSSSPLSRVRKSVSPKAYLPQTAPKVLRKKSSKFGRWRWLWLLFSLTGVAAVSASAGALLAVAIAGTPLMQSPLHAEGESIFNQDDPISSGMNLRLPRLTRPVNILVLGVKVLTSDVDDPPPDVRGLGYHAPVNSLEGLTDSMLLIRFNPETHQVTVLSIPRDTRAWVEGMGLTKINAANAVGGPALSARSTSELLGGVGIDRYVRINVQGVEKLLDALGGVTVYVPKDMKYTDESQHLYINLQQGEQHLNGKQALDFLRFRYDEYGDIGRIQRQQMFMRALTEQALKPATLPRIPQVLSVIQSNLDTNLSVEELIALIGFAAQTDRPNVKMLMVPGDFGSEAEYGASYWIPNHHQIDVMVHQYFGSVNTADSRGFATQARIAIQDSIGDPYTLQNLLNHLGNSGYSNVYVDYPWQEPLATTQIIAQQGDARAAQELQKGLGFGEVLVESTGSLASDITIRLGQDSYGPLLPPALDPTVETIQPANSVYPEGVAPEGHPEAIDPGFGEEESYPTIQPEPLQEPEPIY
jgi:polyisoprenyl-teichoic acid--peptidoglycan teichoic acid transferase